MVDINAVAIANLQIVEQRNTLDVGILAPHQVHGPVGSVANSHVAHQQMAHSDEGQHMGARVELRVFQRLQLIAVAKLGSHEGDTVAVDGSSACDGKVLDVFTPKPHHALAAVLAEST